MTKRFLSHCFLVFALWSWAAVASAQAVERVTLIGNARTRASTVLELLPRQPPASYRDEELAELERRIANLGVFDHVSVTRSGSELTIRVREKWTLTPTFDLATGKTPSDLYLELGATEYNVAGTATSLSVSGYREQRGFGFNVAVAEHESRRHRWSYGGALSYGSVGMRFDDGSEWYDTGPTVTVSALSRQFWGQHFRFRVALWYSHERIDAFHGAVRPPEGHAMQVESVLIYDAYRFHDLTPRGLRAYLSAGPGLFVPAREGRHWVESELIGALPLASYTVLTGRLFGAFKNRGNANHNYLLGSIDGVRGLPDSLYRDWLQGLVNLELRQALPLWWERLALQLVLFADGGAHARMNARGARGGHGYALSAGGGARLVPTFLTELLLRFDVARLMEPERSWFWQFGVSQHF